MHCHHYLLNDDSNLARVWSGKKLVPSCNDCLKINHPKWIAPLWSQIHWMFITLSSNCVFVCSVSSIKLLGRFIYILDISNSSSFPFWFSKMTFISRSKLTCIWIGNSNGSWADKHSSHYSTAKEMSVKATLVLI